MNLNAQIFLHLVPTSPHDIEVEKGLFLGGWSDMQIPNLAEYEYLSHDDINNPPKVPMITGSVQKQPHRESLTDTFASTATAIAHSQQSDASPSLQVRCSPSKTVDIRMKNLDQLCCLQCLWEDGILTEEEFLAQKQIVQKPCDFLQLFQIMA